MATPAHALLPPMSSYQSLSCQPSCEGALRRDRPRRNQAPGASLDAAKRTVSAVLGTAPPMAPLCLRGPRLRASCVWRAPASCNRKQRREIAA
jgi:hypothetical protein